jgi:hypothetical protein
MWSKLRVVSPFAKNSLKTPSVLPAESVVSVHQNLQRLEIDDWLFCWKIYVSLLIHVNPLPQLASIKSNFRRLFSSIPDSEYWAFLFPGLNIQLLQGQVIHATNWQQTGVSTHFGPVRHISRGLRRKSKLCSLGIICNGMLFVFKIKYYLVLSYSMTPYLCNHPVRFLLIDPRGLNRRFVILIVLTFTFTLLVRHRILPCCYWYSYLSPFWVSSWVMVILNLWFNWRNLIVQKLQKVEMWIYRFVRC